MKISHLAAATLVPATLAGVLLTAMPFAQAAPRPRRRGAHCAPRRAGQASDGSQACQAASRHRSCCRAPVGQQQQRRGRQRCADPGAGRPGRRLAQPATASQPLTAGMSAFEQCVAWRESGDNPTASSAGLFGILPSTWAELGYSGTAGQASVALQKVAFHQLYAQYGAQPWAPSDGC